MCEIAVFVSYTKESFNVMDCIEELATARYPKTLNMNYVLHDLENCTILSCFMITVSDVSDKFEMKPIHIGDKILICDGDIRDIPELSEKFMIEPHINHDVLVKRGKKTSFDADFARSIINRRFVVVTIDKNQNCISAKRDVNGTNSMFYVYNQSVIAFASKVELLSHIPYPLPILSSVGVYCGLDKPSNMLVY